MNPCTLGPAARPGVKLARRGAIHEWLGPSKDSIHAWCAAGALRTISSMKPAAIPQARGANAHHGLSS